MKRLDWMPYKRNEQLDMAKSWTAILAVKQGEWSVPAERTGKLSATLATAEVENSVPAGERNPITNARLNTAFKALTAEMRDIKKRYFYIPPLTEANMVALGLKIKDNVLTPVSDPTGQAEANIMYPGRTQLQLSIKHIEGTPLDPKAEYGCRIFFKICAYGEIPPTSGKELHESIFTRQRKHLFTFEQEDSGKTAFFCIRYENSKGKSGPWGPVFSAIIP
jgi:hypothetical protein